MLSDLLESRSSRRQANPTPRTQQVIDSYIDQKTFKGSVLVAKDGKVIFGYGSADPRKR